MQQVSLIQSHYRSLIMVVAAFIVLYLVSLQNYLLFHSIAELFSIVVAGGIFMIAWNSRRIIDNNYLLIIGIAYLFIGGLDLVHTLAYQGMNVFPGAGSNETTQLWIAARYTESLTFLIAALLIGRRTHIALLFTSYSVVTLFFLGAIFYWKIFPDCFVEPQGLTAFKKASEYIISLVFLSAIFLLYHKRRYFDRSVLHLVMTSLILAIVSELAFTFYISLYGLSNLVGHLFKILSYYLIYKAIIETGLVSPYNLLFRSLTQSEEALRRERDKAQKYLDVAGVMIVVMDRDFNVSLINRKGCEILEYSEKEILGKNWIHTFVPEAIREEIRDDLLKLLTGKRKPYDCLESYILQKNGGLRVIAWHNTLLTDEQGNISGMVRSGEDITIRKQTEEAILRAKKDWEKTFDAVPDLIMIVDNDYRISRINFAMANIFKIKPLEAIGRKCYEYFHGEDKPISLCPHARLLSNGREQTEEIYEKRLGRYYLISVSPLYDAAGQVSGSVHIARDITIRKKAEDELTRHRESLTELVKERTLDLTTTNEQLRREIGERKEVLKLLSESEKKFRGLSKEFHALLDAIPDVLLLLSPELKVLWANRGAEKLLGNGNSGLTGKYCFNLWKHGPATCDDCHASKSFQTGQSVTAQITSQDGRFFDSSAFPIEDELGKVSKVIMVYKDITEKINLEAEAVRSSHLASLGELAAGVAHEINNPTNGIINYAQILVNKSKSGGTEADIADRIQKEGERIARIVKSLLFFARDRKEEKSLVHMDAVLAESLALTEAFVRKNGIHLAIDLPSGLYPVLVNAQQIQQVFLNIINNAQYALNQKYPGTNKNKILAISGQNIHQDHQSFVRFTFYDQGTGIAPDILENIMNPFFSTKPSGQGTGLGLSISHGIISDHHGKISFESEYGSYTRVILDLPGYAERDRP